MKFKDPRYVSMYQRINVLIIVGSNRIEIACNRQGYVTRHAMQIVNIKGRYLFKQLGEISSSIDRNLRKVSNDLGNIRLVVINRENLK